MDVKMLSEDITNSHYPLIDTVCHGADRQTVIVQGRGYMQRIRTFLSLSDEELSTLAPEHMPWNAADWGPIRKYVTHYFELDAQLKQGIAGHARAERVRMSLVNYPLTIAYRLADSEW